MPHRILCPRAGRSSVSTGARFVDCRIASSAPRHPGGVEWTSFISGVRASTCTKTKWSGVCVWYLDGRSCRTSARFPTTTRGLAALSEWLSTQQCEMVALEATGVYWKPVWHMLEAQFTLVLANPGHVRAIPGRKSDMNDAAWLADLAAHGLIRSSFVPPAPIQELRDLTRTRKQLVRQIAQHSLRLQKTLEDANLKIASFVSDLLGVSGRAILHGLIEGETSPNRLLARTTGCCAQIPSNCRPRSRDTYGSTTSFCCACI